MVEIEFTPAFEQWWDDLTADEQQSVEFSVELLHAQGVALGHPHTSQIKGSRLGRLRELRIQHQGRPYRVLYAFDPGRTVILLIGGDKGTLGDRWYEIFVPLAERIYDEHLKQLADDERRGQT